MIHIGRRCHLLALLDVVRAGRAVAADLQRKDLEMAGAA